LNTITNTNSTYCAILTTFNGEESIVQAVKSILAQTIKPSEIIIVDDCSTDSTLEILEREFGHIANLRIIVNAVNSGQSYSRNIAARLSSSDLLIIFDDDDISLSDRAREHIQFYEDGANVSFVSSVKIYSNKYQVSCENEERILVKLEPISMLKRLVFGQQSNELGMTWIPASTSAIDRSFFLALDGYDERMRRLEDAEVLIRAAKIGCISSWSSKVLVTRSSTHSEDKGGAIESDFEKLLLFKHQDLLSKSEFRRALNLINVRRAYFSNDLFLMVRLTCSHPSLLFGPRGRFFAFLKRLLHDRRQRG
jgi:glycosyltransferase involved in cell wall biosynthesis